MVGMHGVHCKGYLTRLPSPSFGHDEKLVGFTSYHVGVPKSLGALGPRGPKLRSVAGFQNTPFPRWLPRRIWSFYSIARGSSNGSAGTPPPWCREGAC